MWNRTHFSLPVSLKAAELMLIWEREAAESSDPMDCLLAMLPAPELADEMDTASSELYEATEALAMDAPSAMMWAKRRKKCLKNAKGEALLISPKFLSLSLIKDSIWLPIHSNMSRTARHLLSILAGMVVGSTAMHWYLRPNLNVPDDPMQIIEAQKKSAETVAPWYFRVNNLFIHWFNSCCSWWPIPCHHVHLHPFLHYKAESSNADPEWNANSGSSQSTQIFPIYYSYYERTSSAGNAVTRSCLFAKTSTGTPASLFSLNKLFNSRPVSTHSNSDYDTSI